MENTFVLMAMVSNLTETYNTWISWNGFIEVVDCKTNSVSRMIKTNYPEYSDKTIHCVSLAYLLYTHVRTFGYASDELEENHIARVPLD